LTSEELAVFKNSQLQGNAPPNTYICGRS